MQRGDSLFERQLLTRVADKYESLTSYEFQGHEAVDLGTKRCRIEFGFDLARFKPRVTSEIVLPPAIRFHGGPILSKECQEALARAGPLATPGLWADLSTIATGVSEIRISGYHVLRVDQQNIFCIVLEVQYDEFTEKARSVIGPVRYWIDQESGLVRRLEFGDVTQGSVRYWTVTIETIRLGGQAPEWFTHNLVPLDSPSIIGSPAPPFEHETADGKVVRLTDFRGKVVVLDFWATWCAPCLEEIPIFEKLQKESDSNVEVLGVSSDQPSSVREWLRRNRRPFETLVDAKSIFTLFDVSPIPAVVIINRRGVVVRCFVGFNTENGIRQAIRDALTDDIPQVSR